MRAAALKAAATALTVATTVLSGLYVTTHLKNPVAPLQPTVLRSSGGTAIAGGTVTLGPSVQPSDVQPVTSTYAS